MERFLKSALNRLISAKKRYILAAVLLGGLSLNAASDSADYIKAIIDLLLDREVQLEEKIDGPMEKSLPKRPNSREDNFTAGM